MYMWNTAVHKSRAVAPAFAHLLCGSVVKITWTPSLVYFQYSRPAAPEHICLRCRTAINIAAAAVHSYLQVHPNCSNSSSCRDSSHGGSFNGSHAGSDSSVHGGKEIAGSEKSDASDKVKGRAGQPLQVSEGSNGVGHPPTWRPGGAVQDTLPWLLGSDAPLEFMGAKIRAMTAFRGFAVPSIPGEFARSDLYWRDTVPVGGQHDLPPYLRLPGAPPSQGAWGDATLPMELPLWLREPDMLQACTADDSGRLVVDSLQGNPNPVWRFLGACLFPLMSCSDVHYSLMLYGALPAEGF
jgi:hypothetical protein